MDNDDIPKSPGSVSVVGQARIRRFGCPGRFVRQCRTATTSQAIPPQTPAKGPSAADKKAAIEADLAAAKENLQTLQNDLDILQRKFALDQQTYYSKPDYSSDKAGAAALNDEQDQIDAKQQEMVRCPEENRGPASPAEP